MQDLTFRPFYSFKPLPRPLWGQSQQSEDGERWGAIMHDDLPIDLSTLLQAKLLQGYTFPG